MRLIRISSYVKHCAEGSEVKVGGNWQTMYLLLFKMHFWTTYKNLKPDLKPYSERFLFTDYENGL